MNATTTATATTELTSLQKTVGHTTFCVTCLDKVPGGTVDGAGRCEGCSETGAGQKGVEEFLVTGMVMELGAKERALANELRKMAEDAALYAERAEAGEWYDLGTIQRRAANIAETREAIQGILAKIGLVRQIKDLRQMEKN